MKKILVQVADKNYLDHSKALFANAKHQGRWDGDYCLIANNVKNADLGDFYKAGIKILHTNNPNYYYAKLDVFDIYFKRWDCVLYMDADIIIFDDISVEKEPPKDTMFADLDRPFTIDQYFCQGWPQNLRSDFISELEKEFPHIKSPGFNAGFLYFNTSLINDNTKQNLTKLQEKISKVNNHSGIGGDQPIINLYFYENLNSDSFCSFWRTPEDKIRKAIHFCHGEAPWLNNTYSSILGKTYKQQYQENLEIFNEFNR